MSNTDNIRKMYSKITAPDDAVKKCLEINESKKVLKFPVKRVVAIAACAAVLLAVAIPVGASKIYDAFSAVESYGEQFETYKSTSISFNPLSENSLKVTEGDKLTSSAEGLSITVDKAYYGGEFIYISFVGDYIGEFKNAERFDYTWQEGAGAFLIDGEEYVPYSNCMFSLYKSEGRFAGVLSFTYPYDREELNLKINMPYLDASLQDSDEPLGRIESGFSFDFTVQKSYPDVLVYNADADTEGVYVQGVTSSLGGVVVELFVPEEVELSKAGIVAAVADSEGNGLDFILGEREKTEGGYIHKQYFTPTESDRVNVAVYDKNDTDGCGNSPCVLAELNNVELVHSQSE